MSTESQKEKRVEKTSPAHKALSVIGLLLCAIFGFMLICNLTIIIKGAIFPEKPPSVLGVTPMVVQSGSMSGSAEDHIEVGDLIFVGKADPAQLKEGDVIAFMEGSIVVTHRIVEIQTDASGRRSFITKGDANNVADQSPVPEDRLVGVYQSRIPKVGDVVMFFQTPLGMLLCIGVPLLAFIVYDIIRRQKTAVTEKNRTAELEAELERLRQQQENGPESEDRQIHQ